MLHVGQTAIQDHQIVLSGSRKLIVEWIWQRSYELELSRMQFSLAGGILDFIVSSVQLKEPPGPPTLLGAASIVIATSLEVSEFNSI